MLYYILLYRLISTNVLYLGPPMCQSRRCKRLWFDPCVRQIPWRRAWQLAPVFAPGKFHGRMSLAGYSLWGHKESDMTEHTQQYATLLYSYISHIIVTCV